MKPPNITFPSVKGGRPRFGIGILIGVLLIAGSQFSGSDSVFGMVLGGGVGVALGLTRRPGPEEVDEEAAGAEEAEERVETKR